MLRPGGHGEDADEGGGDVLGGDVGAEVARRQLGYAQMGLALAVLILWDVCLLGVLLRRTLDRDRRVELESGVEKLGH